MKKGVFGVLIVASFIMLAVMPANLVSGDNVDKSGGFKVANYQVVPQNGYDYKEIVDNSVGVARAYVFQRINDVLGDYVIFIQLIKKNGD